MLDWSSSSNSKRFLSSKKDDEEEKAIHERFVMNDHLARSYSWMGSLGIIFIVWFLSLVVFHSLLAFWLITVIYVGHMASYAIGAAIANGRN